MRPKLNKFALDGVQYFWHINRYAGSPHSDDFIDRQGFYFLTVECITLYDGERGWDDIVVKLWDEEDYAMTAPIKESTVIKWTKEELERLKRLAREEEEDESPEEEDVPPGEESYPLL